MIFNFFLSINNWIFISLRLTIYPTNDIYTGIFALRMGIAYEIESCNQPFN